MTKKTRKLAINSFLAITAMAWSAHSLGNTNSPGSSISSTASSTASSAATGSAASNPGRTPDKDA